MVEGEFRELPPDATRVQVYRYTRAYLLFLISVTIFVDASVSKVPTRTKRWEPLKKYHGNPHNLMPPIRQEFDNLQPNEPDEVTSDDRQQAYQTGMCIATLIFDDIAESYMADRKILTMGCPQRTKAWYNPMSHPLIHNIANPPKDILQPHIQEEEDVVPAHEPQYIMRPRGYEDRLASTVMLAEALTLRHKWYPEVYNLVNNTFETLSKFVPVDMGNVEARMEILQRQYNDIGVLDKARHDGVGESSRIVEDLAPSTQPAVEEPRKYNTPKKQYQLKRRRLV
ncbi:hypothetical protein AMTR_s00074p00187130 [Amborella trichopoda]|uniref:Uncharacterized protein n=1 Tax=Amborella trichopoda TaxID=13333 RepID=W1NM92_AMBTC|nr:hypothetical protein AMTR_s00074p00187130 [Amborella trichopoda]